VNSFIEKLVGAAVRTAIVWLAAKFGADVSDNEVAQFVAQATPILLVLAWSFWQKFKEQQKLLTAQAMRAGASEVEVEAEVKRGNAPPVLTPKDVAPV
jgi:hypothetical protein